MYVKATELPRPLQDALSAIGYGRVDIEIKPRTTYSAASISGDGRQALTVAVDLDSGQYRVLTGAWGGPSPWDERQADLDTAVRPLLPNQAVINGVRGGGHPVYASISMHPDNLTALLPASVELTDDEARALEAIRGLNSRGRKEQFPRWGLGEYRPEHPAIVSLADRGLVKVSRNGAVKVTTEGRNAASHYHVKSWSGEVERR